MMKTNRSYPLSLAAWTSLMLLLCAGFSGQNKISAAQSVDSRAPESVAARETTANIYFADKENRFLVAEAQTFMDPGSTATFARKLIQALIQGPRDGAANQTVRTLPAETNLSALYITAEGCAYLDFDAGIVEHLPGGVMTEKLAVYSLVNTLILNIPDIKQVKLLVGGQEVATLSGHLDVRPCLGADLLLIR